MTKDKRKVMKLAKQKKKRLSHLTDNSEGFFKPGSTRGFKTVNRKCLGFSSCWLFFPPQGGRDGPRRSSLTHHSLGRLIFKCLSEVSHLQPMNNQLRNLSGKRPSPGSRQGQPKSQRHVPWPELRPVPFWMQSRV